MQYFSLVLICLVPICLMNVVKSVLKHNDDVERLRNVMRKYWSKRNGLKPSVTSFA